jgi:glucose-1-phosphatase
MKVLVFDMGHVFIDFEWEAVCLGFCQRAGCPPESLRPVFEHLSRLGYESGLIETDEFLRELNAQLKTDITLAEFKRLFTHTFRENEEMIGLLQTLRKQRPLYLLSNTNEVHYEWLQAQFDVAKHFDDMVLSYKVHCCKPDEAIYRMVLDIAGAAPGDCLFVDDLEHNVRAAKKIGINTILFRGAEPLKSELRNLGFSV